MNIRQAITFAVVALALLTSCAGSAPADPPGDPEPTEPVVVTNSPSATVPISTVVKPCDDGGEIVADGDGYTRTFGDGTTETGPLDGEAVPGNIWFGC